LFLVVLVFGSLVIVLAGSSDVKAPPGVLNHLQQGLFIPMNDGNQIFVRLEGPVYGERILLLHGFTQSSFVYRYVIPYLVEYENRVIAFDLPGTGLSDKPKKYNFTRNFYLDSIKELLSKLDIDQVHFVLSDMTVPIGIEFAIKYPSIVRSITILNTFYGIKNIEESFPANFIPKIIFPYLYSNNIGSSFLNWMLYRTYWSKSISRDNVADHSYLFKYNNGIDAYFNVIKNFNNSKENEEYLKNSLSKLNIPIQMIASKSIPSEHFEYFKIPSSNRHTIESSYLLPEDDPNTLSLKLNAFRQSLPPSKNIPSKESITNAQGGHSHGHDHSHGHSHGHDHGHNDHFG